MTKVKCNNKSCENNKNEECISKKIEIYTGAIGTDWCHVECRTYSRKQNISYNDFGDTK